MNKGHHVKLINTEVNFKGVLGDFLKKIGFPLQTWGLITLNETLVQILVYVLINDHHCVVTSLDDKNDILDKTVFVFKGDTEAILDRHLNRLTYDLSLKILKD